MDTQKELNSFIKMSREIGSRFDQIQAGGGNTSLKLSDKTMAVKSSGSQLRNMEKGSGYVLLPYEKVVEVFGSANRDPKHEKDITGAILNLVIPEEGAKPQRPSVEAGFHAMLGKCVIHTHSVYANYFNCTNNGAEELEAIFTAANLSYIYYPFINPGAPLTFQIMDDCNSYAAQGKAYPNIIFLENHGLIVWHDDADECMALYNRVDNLLKQVIYKTQNIVPYPSFADLAKTDNGFASNNPFLKDMAVQGIASAENIAKYLLYPDQIVYLNAGIEGENPKIRFENGTVLYACSQTEAQALEEALLAFVYLLYLAKASNKKLRNMPDSGIAFILGWDAEKYRKSQIK